MTTPRGIRLNNPGNIRHSKDKWQGAAPEQPDKAFVAFIAPEWGIRAIAKLMISYEKKGFDTPRKIITRYAPDNENDTEAYVQHVASGLDVDPDHVIDVDDFAVMLPLVETIIKHENGVSLPRAKVIEGLRLAGVSDTPQASFIKKTGAKAAAGVAVCCAAVSEVAEPAKQAASSLADFTGAPIIAHVATIALTVAGVATMAGLIGDWVKHRKGLL